MRALLDRFYDVCGAAAAFLVVAMCAVIFAQVSFNFLSKLFSSINITIPSYSDMTGFMLTGASFLALAPTLRKNELIRVEIIVSRIRPRFRIVIEMLVIALAMAICAVGIFYTTNLVVESVTYRDTSTGTLPIPLWLPQSTIPFGLAATMIALADMFFELFREKDDPGGKA